MFAVFRTPRKPLTRPLARIAALVSAFWVAACDPIATGSTGPSINTDAPVPVALLVPGGSGSSGDELIARSLRQAAQLAVSDLQGAQIDLRVYDTGPSAAGAASAATRAVDEGAKIILGPVYAEAANAAGVAVAGRGVNVLSFSNNPDIAGGNVFVLGPTFQNTANRLVSYAAGQGRGRIMVVHDRNASGEAGKRAIESAIGNSRGASLAGTGSYDFSQEGVVAAVPNIVSTARDSGAQSMFFTADTAGALPLLAQLLPEAGLDRETTRFIGLTRWDIPAATLALPGVQGGWFALPDPTLNQQFQSRYQSAFGEAPHPISGLAYDGIAAIGALVKAGKADALTTSALTQGSGFVGVSGIFRLRSDGTNERGLAVGQVRNNQVYVIDPAPRSFGGAGF
ncbi:ABC transporter substrate-binding protein [Frigidibacter albus]|uniref:ABC transporter substrate-binding protein n=1 Tax=Frigidibacter albus TaxID=1465486 RepID=A0A6L8VH71_9RHOB|nr:penicillin-binding protein activator [Frigidibacter albus]MZQ88669.1 ABC transporter substrate-binding protein [Frigidibacter albus]NBE30522.1 ABC transporter substrate-binding protein [Frigidibacter albus]GGH49748.1 penicillin-binding protein activator [Frigidibacter albus]